MLGTDRVAAGYGNGVYGNNTRVGSRADASERSFVVQLELSRIIVTGKLGTKRPSFKLKNRRLTEADCLLIKIRGSQISAYKGEGESILPNSVYDTLKKGIKLDFNKLKEQYVAETAKGGHSKVGFPETIKRILFSCTQKDPLYSSRKPLIKSFIQYLLGEGYTWQAVNQAMRFQHLKRPLFNPPSRKLNNSSFK
jgi:hypothetical protein